MNSMSDGVPRVPQPDDFNLPTPENSSILGEKATAPKKASSSLTVMVVKQQIKLLVAPAGLVTLAMELAVVLAVGLVSSFFAYFSLKTYISETTLASNLDVFSLVPVVLGALLGSGLTMSVSAFGINAVTSLFAVSGTVVALEVVLLRVLLKHRMRYDGSDASEIASMSRSFIEGLFVALVVALFTSFFSIGEDGNTIYANPLSTFVVVLLVVWISTYSVRCSATTCTERMKHLGSFIEELRGFTRVVLPLVCIMVVLVGVPFLFSKGMGPSVPLIILYLPNIVFCFFGVAFFGAVSVGGAMSYAGFNGEYYSNISIWSMGTTGLLIALLTIVTIFTSSVSVGVQRERKSAPTWNRVWKLPVAVSALTLLGIMIFNIRVSISGVSGTAGLAFWTVVSVAITTLVISILAEFSPQLLAVHAPRLLLLCGGRRALTWQDASHVHETAITPENGLNQVSMSDVQPISEADEAVVPVHIATKKRTRIAAITVGAIALLAVVACVGVAIINGQNSPEAKVREYLQFLADGDADAASAMVDPGIPNGQRAFLSNSVLQSASSRIEIVDLAESSSLLQEKDERRITATLSLDGQQFTRDFVLKQGKKTYGIFDNWQLKGALTTRVNVDAYGVHAVKIGDTVQPIDRETRTITVYPGIYTVSAADTGEYISVQPVVLNTASSSLNVIRLEAKYTESLKTAALKADIAKVESCGSRDHSLNMADDCPNSVRSDSLSVLNVKKIPDQIAENTLAGGYTVKYAVFEVQRGGSGIFADTQPREIRYNINVRVVTDSVTGEIKTDSQGNPVFEFTWSFAF